MTHPQLPDWHGRDDTPAEGPEAVRWHQKVIPWTVQSKPGFTLLGFACDEGVCRNLGRVGSAQAPEKIRQTLSNLAWHHASPLYDAGNVSCQHQALEAAQEQLGNAVSLLLKSGQQPIVLGGGHETAWGTYLGLHDTLKNRTLGIINLDAHFDLRQSSDAHSGTPFAQIAEHCQAFNRPFHYLCAGVSEAANTKALFQRAASLKAKLITDEELTLSRYQNSLDTLCSFINQVDCLYLSIDLDVLPIATMSAVSAPAAFGVQQEVIMHIIQMVAKSGKLLVADIVEYNPLLDHDHAGARVAARLIWHLTKYWQPLSENTA